MLGVGERVKFKPHIPQSNVYATVISEIAKYLRSMTGAPYILEREAVISDQRRLDKLAMMEVMRNLERPRVQGPDCSTGGSGLSHWQQKLELRSSTSVDDPVSRDFGSRDDGCSSL